MDLACISLMTNSVKHVDVWCSVCSDLLPIFFLGYLFPIIVALRQLFIYVMWLLVLWGMCGLQILSSSLWLLCFPNSGWKLSLEQGFRVVERAGLFSSLCACGREWWIQVSNSSKTISWKTPIKLSLLVSKIELLHKRRWITELCFSLLSCKPARYYASLVVSLEITEGV